MHVWLPYVIALAWWLLSRPYKGISHDGLLYTVQALGRFTPEQYQRDIFFLYGSQDRFTLFSILHAELIGGLGIDRAFMLLTIVGGLMWILTLVSLLRRWLCGFPLIAALILILSADAHYAGHEVFSFGEQFATPRIFAEALTLLAIKLWLESRIKLATGVVALALSIHPIIALAGVGVLCCSFLLKYAKVSALLWVIVLFMGLLGMRLLILTGLSPSLDPAWREVVELRSPFLFPHLWNGSDWLRVLFDITILWLSARHLRTEAGRVASWILALLPLALAWTQVASLMDIQLAVAAQLPRVQWLAHLLALAMVVPLCLSLWKSESLYQRCLASTVACSLIYPLNLGGAVIPAFYCLCRWAEYQFRGKPITPVAHFLLMGAAPLMGLALALLHTYANLLIWGATDEKWDILMIARHGSVAMALFIGSYVLSSCINIQRLWLVIYTALILCIGTLSWDVRKSWDVYSDSTRVAAILPVRELIPDKAVIFWASNSFMHPEGKPQIGGGARETWLWLNRSSYASHLQAAGSIFYRQTAIELSRRIAHLQEWGYREETLDWASRHNRPVMNTSDINRIKGVCTDSVIDFIIATEELENSRFVFSDPLTTRTFWIYECKQIGH